MLVLLSKLTKLNTDIKLPYHRHNYQIASIRIKFNESGESFDDMWPVCAQCLKMKEHMDNKKLQKIWDKYDFDIEIKTPDGKIEKPIGVGGG